jgi:hypothetical protein
MSGATAIDVMYENAITIGKALEARNEVSLQVVVGENFRKILLLASASYFEHQICGAVLNFVSERSNGSALITNFVRNKAIARQYHTWFNWTDNNANQFFGLFGPDFRAEMVSKIKCI